MILWKQLFGKKNSFTFVTTVFTPNWPSKVQSTTKYLKAPNCETETLFDLDFQVVSLLVFILFVIKDVPRIFFSQIGV